MYEFTPFKKSDKLQFSSFIQFPRELLKREEYKILNPNAMLLFSVLADRLDLSFKQIDKNSKVKFYDDKGNMYVIFKRDEIQEKLHLKRSALDTALNLLKDCNLIQEKKQGKNLPNIIYVGKAKNLKRRVSSYFNKEHDSIKTNILVNNIGEVIGSHTGPGVVAVFCMGSKR